jgi:GTP-binding protein
MAAFVKRKRSVNEQPAFSVSYNSARFMRSAQTLTQCPPDQGCEIAFAGRSNAGKSSALNAITGHTKLARTGKTPGRTQLLNFFSLHHPDCRLVDLPGYGYAKVSRDTQQAWHLHLNAYLQQRNSLCGLVLVMDIRHPMTDFDQMIMEWSNDSQLPLLILLTKADKLNFGQAKSILLKLQQEVNKRRNDVQFVLFSALKKTGVNEAKQALDRLFEAGLDTRGEPEPENDSE